MKHATWCIHVLEDTPPPPLPCSCGATEPGVAESINFDWAIQSIVDGSETDRIVPVATESEARDWVTRFPQSYKLLRRVSAGPWMAA